MKVLFCIPGETFSDQFLKSWTLTINMLHREGIEYALASEVGSEITGLRNRVAGGMSERGEFQTPHPEQEYDCQFWIDSDMIWTPLDVLALLESPHDIIAGLYADGKGEVVAFAERNERLKYGQGVVPCYAVGFGFVRLKREVLEKLPYPWFRLSPSEEGGHDSEDVSFCRLAREHGYEIMADTDVLLGHQKTMIVRLEGMYSPYV